MVYFEIGLYMLLQLPFLYLIQKTALKNCSGNKKLWLWKLFYNPCLCALLDSVYHWNHTHTSSFGQYKHNLHRYKRRPLQCRKTPLGFYICLIGYLDSGCSDTAFPLSAAICQKQTDFTAVRTYDRRRNTSVSARMG